MRTIVDARIAPLRDSPSAVAIGNFDGVHVGHVAVIRAMVSSARRAGLAAVVLTFTPHTARVFAREYAPPLITSYAERAALVAALGPDLLVEQAFDDAIASMSAATFAESFLRGLMGARAVFVGYDFTYGRGREGNVETLRAYCRDAGLYIEVVPQVRVQGMPVSSTRIREFIHEGNMEGAALLLGRRCTLRGRVVPGAGRGRGLGYPTANIAGAWEIIPPAGVYAAFARMGDRRLKAAVNIGTNPTFAAAPSNGGAGGGGPVTVEAFLMGFEGDLYGQEVTIEFVRRIRPELRFESADALARRIGEDVAAIEAHLAGIE